MLEISCVCWILSISYSTALMWFQPVFLVHLREIYSSGLGALTLRILNSFSGSKIVSLHLFRDVCVCPHGPFSELLSSSVSQSCNTMHVNPCGNRNYIWLKSILGNGQKIILVVLSFQETHPWLGASKPDGPVGAGWDSAAFHTDDKSTPGLQYHWVHMLYIGLLLTLDPRSHCKWLPESLTFSSPLYLLQTNLIRTAWISRLFHLYLHWLVLTGVYSSLFHLMWQGSLSRARKSYCLLLSPLFHGFWAYYSTIHCVI